MILTLEFSNLEVNAPRVSQDLRVSGNVPIGAESSLITVTSVNQDSFNSK